MSNTKEMVINKLCFFDIVKDIFVLMECINSGYFSISLKINIKAYENDP